MDCRWRDHGIPRGNNGANYEGTRFPTLPTYPSRITSRARERADRARSTSRKLAGILCPIERALLYFNANDPAIDHRRNIEDPGGREIPLERLAVARDTPRISWSTHHGEEMLVLVRDLLAAIANASAGSGTVSRTINRSCHACTSRECAPAAARSRDCGAERELAARPRRTRRPGTEGCPRSRASLNN